MPYTKTRYRQQQAYPGFSQYRLTLESGVSVSSTDQLTKTRLYLTPHNGNLLSLYTASNGWQWYQPNEIFIDPSGLITNRPYDVFAFDAGTVASSVTPSGTTAGTGTTVTLPSNSAGQLLLIWSCGTSFVSTPGGWNLVRIDNDSGSNNYTSLIWKYSTGDTTVTVTGAVTWQAACIPNATLDTNAATAYNSTSTANIICPTATAAVNGSILFSLYHQRATSATLVPPGGQTTTTTQSGTNVTSRLGYEAVNSGATGTRTATSNTSNTIYIATTVIVRPFAASGVNLQYDYWSSGTARQTALTTQDGALIKTGDASRVYQGTFLAATSTAIHDAPLNPWLWNNYNRVVRPFKGNYASNGTTDATTTSATYAVLDSSAQIAICLGIADRVDVDIHGLMYNATAASNADVYLGVRVNGTTDFDIGGSIVDYIGVTSGQPQMSIARRGNISVGAGFQTLDYIWRRSAGTGTITNLIKSRGGNQVATYISGAFAR